MSGIQSELEREKKKAWFNRFAVTKGSSTSGNYRHRGLPKTHGGSQPGGGHGSLGISAGTSGEKVKQTVDEYREGRESRKKYVGLDGRSVTVPDDATGRAVPGGWRSTIRASKWEKGGRSRLYVNVSVYDKRGRRRRTGDLGFIDLNTGKLHPHGRNPRNLQSAIDALMRGENDG